MKYAFCLVTLLSLVAASAPAQTCEFFSDSEDFLAALGPVSESLDFNSAAAGAIDGDEFAASGFIFDSPLAPPNGQLEVAPSDFFWDSNYLSIDSRPFSGGQDRSDSLEIFVQGSFFAIGFDVIDGSITPPTEALEVFDDDGALICTAPVGEAYDYVGIISPVAIAAVLVTEGTNDADDVGYDDFVLGGALFADGFESGNVDRWSSSTVP